MRKQITFFLTYIPILNLYCQKPETFEKIMIKRLEQLVKIDNKNLNHLYEQANKEDLTKKIISSKGNLIPLFKAYPNLQKKISHIKLGNLPTPIIRCKNLENNLNTNNIFIKRDDLSGKIIGFERLFGGNKVRKLEFLLAQALANNSKSVITFGSAGSNHALATATYCNYLGLKCYLLLKPQHNSTIVRRNLLLNLNEKSKIYACPNNEIRSIFATSIFFKNKLKNGSFPYVIPLGGSCIEGIIGYVNAAFELKEQITSGIIQEPDKIYIALGSCGSTAGLILGLKAADIKSKVIAVAVSPEKSKNLLKNKILKLLYDTNNYLHILEPSFKKFIFKHNDINIITNFCGKEYGLFTPEAQDAISLLNKTEKVMLDGTYTAKAFAALLHDLKTQKEQNEIILFWNTFCADDFSKKIKKLDYKKLPQSFHKYFIEDVQKFDKLT